MRLAATKVVLAVLVGSGVAVASTPPPAPADLASVLERAGQYVVEYEQAFHDIAAEETYTQRTAPQQKMGGGIALLCTPAGCQRRTRADVVFVRLRGEVPWGAFRDVFEVDGQKVRDREARLESLFGASSPASGAERVQAILKESARYNIGPAVRNINFPTMALAFLLPQNQQRFAWKRGGTRRFTTVDGLEVHFEETARPTMVDDDARGDLPAKGRFWIDPARGTVLRSETTFRFEPDRAWAYVATQYRPEPKLAMWVPAEMRETYQDLRGVPIFGSPSEATAQYSNFRRFTVTIEDVTARLADQPAAATPPGPPAEPPGPPPQPAPAKPAERLPQSSRAEPTSQAPTAQPTEPQPRPPHPDQPAQAQPAPAPPTFPSGVELITVDAVVLDKDGQPVPGLTKDDFVVKEDGQPRDVVSFEAFDVRAPREEPQAAAPDVVASNEAPASGLGRGFAIVVDDLGIAPERTQAAQETAKAFLERSVRDGDLVALGTTSGNAWWSARLPEGREDLLVVLARARGRLFDELAAIDRMSDYEAFWITNHDLDGSVIDRVVKRWETTGACPVTAMGSIGCPAKVRAKANFLDGIRRHRLVSTLTGVRRAIEALALVRGRRSVVLLSDGFLDDSGSDVRSVAALSREARAAVYFVDVRGLQALPGGLGSAADAGPPTTGRERFEEATLEPAGAVALADDTGGFSVRNTNDLTAGAGRVAAESRVFYLLGFHPLEGKPPGDWRKLSVQVKRPGLTVRARRGYTLRSEMSADATKPGREKRKEPAPDPAVARALDSPASASGIPLRAIAYMLEPRPKDTVHVLVAAELDAAAGSVGPGKRQLEVNTVALLRDTDRAFQHDDRVTVSAPKSDEPRWRAFAREFELPPGIAQIRIVVRDPATGAIGSVVQRIEVPSPGEFRVSTPVLTDRVEPATAAGQLPQPALAAHRVFSGGGLYCRYEVFGAARPDGEAPRVSSGFQLRSGNGIVVEEAPATPMSPDHEGRLVRIVGASLEGLQEGAYELVIEVRDEASGKSFVRHEPFVVAQEGH